MLLSVIEIISPSSSTRAGSLSGKRVQRSSRPKNAVTGLGRQPSGDLRNLGKEEHHDEHYYMYIETSAPYLRTFYDPSIKIVHLPLHAAGILSILPRSRSEEDGRRRRISVFEERMHLRKATPIDRPFKHYYKCKQNTCSRMPPP